MIVIKPLLNTLNPEGLGKFESQTHTRAFSKISAKHSLIFFVRISVAYGVLCTVNPEHKVWI
jgi:hypothetical protein